MNKYLSILKSSFIGILIAVGIFYWGYVNEGYIRMGIAVFIFFASIKVSFDNFNFAIELDNWTNLNQGKLILFYPTKKSIQQRIKSDFIPKIPYEIMEVYYDGPRLVGDIKRSIIIEIMKWNSKVKVNSPVICKIVDKSLIIEELDELKEIENSDINVDTLLERIERVKNCT